jgi:glycyl-tRNA synthetase
MFVDFKRVVDTMRRTLPFGIAQVGRVFRNEITPGNFTFRTLEFDLMEFEYFVPPQEWERWFEYWLGVMQRWLTAVVGIEPARVRVREHATEERAHYSSRTIDIEYETPFGWKELFGLAYRSDFDLRNHSEMSGLDLRMLDRATGEKFFPHVVEPTFGLTRLVLVVLLDAYHEEEVKGEQRTVLKLKPWLAPYQVAVLPLMRKPELVEVAKRVARELRRRWSVDLDFTQSIGKRYRRQDEIGTPYCVTIDFDTLQDQAVTIRDRDTMAQDRIALEKVADYIQQRVEQPAGEAI